MALCPKHLLSIANWTKASRLNQDKIKSEKHGYVKGLHAPSEAGALHRFFFETHSDETHKEQVRETFSYLGLSGGQPLLVKNLNNTFRLKRIVEHFPDARFIMITRNKLDAASSLLRARLKEHKSLNCWFGPKPPGFEKFLNYTPAYQVLWQIAEMENIARNFVQEYHCPFYEIELNELISNPGLLKKQIMKFLNLPSKNNQATEGIRPLKSSNINSDWLSDLNTALDELKTAGVRIQS